MSAVTTKFGTLETVDATFAPATPKQDSGALLATFFDTTKTIQERKVARRLYFGALCERGTHRAGAPIVGGARPGLDNPMVGEPTYYRVGPRRACDLQGSGRIFEYSLKQEAYTFGDEERLGWVVDVFDLGLNAAEEPRHIGVVRRDGLPFTNPQFAYQATIGANGWLHQYWDRDARAFAESEAGVAHAARVEAHLKARDEAEKQRLAAQAQKVNELIALAAEAGSQAEWDALAADVAREKRVLNELKAQYERRPLENEGPVF